MSARPSKRFLFRRLKAELARSTHGIGVDAASADFKNRRLFKTNVYVGLDIHVPSLRAGLRKYPDRETTLGVACDLVDLSSLAKEFAEVVVTTNTFHHIPSNARLAALTNLIALTKPGGGFLCECTMDEGFPAFVTEIERAFDEVRVTYYKNAASLKYERFFERGGLIEERSVATFPLVLVLAELLSRLEGFTSFSQKGNRHAFIVARRRKVSGSQWHPVPGHPEAEQ